MSGRMSSSGPHKDEMHIIDKETLEIVKTLNPRRAKPWPTPNSRARPPRARLDLGR